MSIVREYVVVNRVTHKAFHPDGWTSIDKAKRFQNIRLAGSVIDLHKTKADNLRIKRA